MKMDKETNEFFLSFILILTGVSAISFSIHYGNNDVISMISSFIGVIFLIMYEYHNYKLRVNSKGESNEDNEN